MKLIRYGEPGAERPGLVDAEGQLRDLSGHVADLTGDTIGPDGLARIAAIDPESLPPVAGEPRIGPDQIRLRQLGVPFEPFNPLRGKLLSPNKVTGGQRLSGFQQLSFGCGWIDVRRLLPGILITQREFLLCRGRSSTRAGHHDAQRQPL